MLAIFSHERAEVDRGNSETLKPGPIHNQVSRYFASERDKRNFRRSREY
jgi:hypothetical protein